MLEALSPINLLYCFSGAFLGTLIGILPGIGPALIITTLIPFLITISNDITVLVFLASIFYGSQYGSSTSAIVLNVPGEPSSIPTMIAGNRLYKQGLAYDAILTAAVSSFIAGLITSILVFFAASSISNLSFILTPVDVFWLCLVTIIVVIFSSGKNILLNINFCFVAFLLGTIGIDPFKFEARNTFGIDFLENGISIILMIAAIFGINEIIANFKDESYKHYIINKTKTKLRDIFTNVKVLKSSLRGTFIGTVFGILPGVGTVLASNLSYALENKKGKTDLELIAAPEAANNAVAQTSFIPLLLLGIPTTFMMVIVYSVLLMLDANSSTINISQNNSEILYTIALSMLVGNVFLLFLNSNLSLFWIKILSIPRTYIFSFVLFLLVLGIFSFSKSPIAFALVITLSILGIFIRYLDGNLIAFITTFLLASKLDNNFQRNMILNENNIFSFFQTPVSIGIIVFGVLFSFWLYKKSAKQTS